jgi:hypothetical protein
MSKLRSRNFGRTKTLQDFDPLEFTLNDQTFSCRRAIQGSVLLEFISNADSQDGGRSARALEEFFKDVLPPDDHARFQIMLKDPEIIVNLSDLGEIAAWLIEEYTARPTQGPNSSSSGPLNSGPVSTEDVSAPVSVSADLR